MGKTPTVPGERHVTRLVSSRAVQLSFRLSAPAPKQGVFRFSHTLGGPEARMRWLRRTMRGFARVYRSSGDVTNLDYAKQFRDLSLYYR
jgi:hypothetical protein